MEQSYIEEKKKEENKETNKKWISWLASDMYVACVPSLSTYFLHDSLGYVHCIVGVRSVGKFMVSWCLVGCSLVI